MLQHKRRCNSSVSKNAPSGRKTHHGGAPVSRAGGPPMPRVVKMGKKPVKMQCVCVGYSQTKAMQRKCHALSTGYILCLKKYVSPVLSDMLKKGERKQSSEIVPVLLPR